MRRISYTRYARSVDAFEGNERLDHKAIQAEKEAQERREKALRERIARARILEAA